MEKDLKRQAVEGRFKGAIRRLSLPPVPPSPPIPISLVGATDEQKELWQLRADVDILRTHYTALTRYITRGILALITVLAPALGWNVVAEVIKYFGW